MGSLNVLTFTPTSLAYGRKPSGGAAMQMTGDERNSEREYRPIKCVREMTEDGLHIA